MQQTQTDTWYNKQSALTLKRILPRLESRVLEQVDNPADWEGYLQRVHQHFPRFFKLLHQLYGDQYDFFYHLYLIMESATDMWLERNDDLKALDAVRLANPHWHQSHRMIGAMAYVDLFADNLEGIRQHIPYLKEMGITYLHLMPLFRTPDGDDDGGYAISSYREVCPELGTMEQLAELTSEFRHHGISLALDFVFNHTSDDHDWARAAQTGDEDYQSYYRMFRDRTMPDQYEENIIPVFPDENYGCFTYISRIRRWVWTTFYNYQWDLNYENPMVFNAMAREMMFLANQGVEILRLDAVAFLWKRIGTNCQNQPEAHCIIQAFNALIQMTSPAMVFKSEAIVHPDEVNKYIDPHECQLSYNPQLMALLWNSLATRDTTLLRHALNKRFELPGGCTWVNYVRCHDDIGWVFSDDDANELNIIPSDHRRFLTNFFIGNFEGSFSRGQPFQEDPNTGDARVSGTTASLTGLERGIEEQNPEEIELAIKRILLLYGVSFTIGGIPLLYLGDELGTLNDYRYQQDNEKLGDSRWLHRARFNWQDIEQRWDRDSITGQVYAGMLRLVQVRQQNLAFTRAETELIDAGNKHILGYFRHHPEQSVLVLANFSEQEQVIEARRLRLLGLRKTLTDIVEGRTIITTEHLLVAPYQLMVLVGVR